MELFTHSVDGSEILQSMLQVVYNNVTAQYYSGYAGNNPTQYTQRTLYAIDQLGTAVSSQASQTGNTTITWAGPTSLALPASANVTGKYPDSAPHLAFITAHTRCVYQSRNYLRCLQAQLLLSI